MVDYIIFKEIKYAAFFAIKAKILGARQLFLVHFIHRSVTVSMVNSINHLYKGQNIRYCIFLVQNYKFPNFKCV